MNSYAQKKDLDTSDNSTSSRNLLVQQSTLYLKKHAWFIALVPAIIYYHKDIASFMSHRPYISSLTFYLLLNYLCDAILNYQQQQSLLKIIALLKKTTLYLVLSHGIKNHIHQKKLSIEPHYEDDQAFLNSITANLPYSFNEVTLIALKSYQELKSSLQTLNIALNIESEEFVFLCHASSINVCTLLYLTQNNPTLYAEIYHFEKDPQMHLKPLLEHLRSEITKTFIDLEQLLLTLNVQTRTSS
jgi:hypothetical protein